MNQKKSSKCPERSSEDDYEHVVAAGQSNIVGNFIEKSRSNSNVITSNKTLKLYIFQKRRWW